MAKPSGGGQDWIYYDMPPKGGRTPLQVPPPSQIPFSEFGTVGIKDSASDSVVVDQHSKRNWTRDTDSKYVKLAKAGGRKDLFKYREHQPSQGGPVPYPRVDWFDHVHDDPPPSQISERVQYKSNLPDWYVHDEYECETEDFITVPPQRRPIMGFDDLSVWKREGEHDDKQTKSVTFPAINKQLKKGQMKSKKEAPQPIRIGKRTYFPKIRSGKESPENIKQLLSMGYQSKWLEEQRTKQKEDDSKKSRDKKAKRTVKRRAHKMLQRKKQEEE